MFESILVICTANLCRSPMAEILFKTYLPNKTIASAGTNTQKLNLADKAADENVITIVKEHGFDLSDHKARQVTKELVEQFELILVMDDNQREYIAHTFQGTRPKILLIGQWINLGKIVDPYNKTHIEFLHCFKELERAVVSWSNRLSK